MALAISATVPATKHIPLTIRPGKYLLPVPKVYALHFAVVQTRVVSHCRRSVVRLRITSTIAAAAPQLVPILQAASSDLP